MDTVDCIIVGAGVVGLAIARAFAQHGVETIILESETSIGTQTSSRNNEVIHAGFMYEPGSLKSQLCATGREALYRYCQDHGVACSRVGKFVIATNDEESVIVRTLVEWAADNDVLDLEFLDRSEAGAREPNLDCQCAIYSPSTGVVDSHALMLCLLGDAEAAGAVIAYDCRVVSIQTGQGRIFASSRMSENKDYVLSCRVLVNAAGLGAARIENCRGERQAPDIGFAKGNFFALRGKAPFRSLVVPVSDTLALGGAFTIDTGGQGKFGPDLEWVQSIDYSVAEERKPRFVDAIRRYYPAIAANDLQPGYSGIRPRIGKNGATSDWLVERSCDGSARIINLFGIDTPGLTACLSIADHVLALSA